ncbi:25345_t:CDS:1, partial [Racocetra persica]
KEDSIEGIYKTLKTCAMCRDFENGWRHWLVHNIGVSGFYNEKLMVTR